MATPIWRGDVDLGSGVLAAELHPVIEPREGRIRLVGRADLMPVDPALAVDPGHVVRAFEVEKGRYVPVEWGDLGRPDVELARSIEIRGLVTAREGDPFRFRDAYYLVPQAEGEAAFREFVRVVAEGELVAVAAIAIRDATHEAYLRPFEDVIVLETLYGADEVRRPPGVPARTAS